MIDVIITALESVQATASELSPSNQELIKTALEAAKKLAAGPHRSQVSLVSSRNARFNPKETSLLDFFQSRAGDLLTYEQILTSVWGWPAKFVTAGRPTTVRNTVQVHVHRLRKGGVQIETVRGVGYRYLGQTNPTGSVGLGLPLREVTERGQG